MMVDDAQGLAGDDVRDILAMKLVTYVHAVPHVQAPDTRLHGRVIEIVLMPGPEAYMALKASVQRRVLLLVVAQMPFARYMRRIATTLSRC